MASQPTGNTASSSFHSIKDRLICAVCKKLLVDAVVLDECRHIYCRACLLGHLELNDRCADCLTLLGPNKTSAFKSDPVLQELVYKLNPGHYFQEVQNRKDFSTRRRLQGSEKKTVMDPNLMNVSRYICREDERVPVNLVYRSPYAMGKPSTSTHSTHSSAVPNVATRVKMHLKVPVGTTIGQLRMILEKKTDIPDPSYVTFVDKTGIVILDDSTTLRDIVYRYPINRKKPIRIMFTFLKQSPEEQEKPPVLDLMATSNLSEQPPNLWAEEEPNPNKPNVLDLNMVVTLPPSRLEKSCLGNNGEPAEKIININKRAVPPSQMPNLSPAVDGPQKKRKKTSPPMKRSSDSGEMASRNALHPSTPVTLMPQAVPTTPTNSAASIPTTTTTAVQKFNQLQAVPIQLGSNVATTSAGTSVLFTFGNATSQPGQQRPQQAPMTTSAVAVSDSSIFSSAGQQQPIPIQPRPQQMTPMTFIQMPSAKNGKNSGPQQTQMLIPVNAFGLPFVQGNYANRLVPHIIANGSSGQVLSVFQMGTQEILRT